MFGFSALAAVVLTLQAKSPVGTYRVDLKASPKKSRGMVQALFGTSSLRLSPDGTFKFIGVERKGFWRQEGTNMVLNFDGFFTIQEAVPDDVLKRRKPDGELEGLIFRKSGEKLTLARHGAVNGPIVLTRQPKRATKTLLRISDSDEAYKGMLAFVELFDDMESRWPELLSLALNKQEAFEVRMSAAVMFKVRDNAKAADAVLRALRSSTFHELAEKQRSRLRRALQGSFRETKDSAIARLAFENLAEMDDAHYLSPLAAKGQVISAVPKLVEWAKKSKSVYGQAAAIDALSDLGANDHLAAILPHMEDSDPRVQISSAAFVLRHSESEGDRRSAEAVLVRHINDSEWVMQADVVKAWEMSGRPESVRHLAAVLLSNREAVVRRNAAQALGKLGFPQAIPVLLESKLRTSSSANGSDESWVKKAVVEALWKFDQKRLNNKQRT